MSEQQLSITCLTKACEQTSDLGVYNLQTAAYYNTTSLSFLVNCPAGYVCPAGTFPKVFTYAPGTFSLPQPPTHTGFPIVFSLEGCSSLVTVVLPGGSSASEQAAAAQLVINMVAEQQALCDAIASLPPGSNLNST